MPIKPPVPVVGPPSHHLELSITVQGELFSLSGVFTLAEGMAAFDRWVAKLGGGGLTQAELTATLARAEKLAARLEGLDAQQ